ncbi:MAG: hypothetical protein AAF230_08320 [Pseudomonadota bacterium]
MKTRSNVKRANPPNSMDPHPDFATVDLPRRFDVGACTLTPLDVAAVDEDFAAVLATAPLMEGIFGDWPAGLTRETNLIDMAWHDREFDARRSFSWIIRDAEGTYLGCFYLFPELGTRGRAKATFWLCDLPDRVGFAATLKQDLSSWLADKLSPAIILTWVTRPTL